MIFTVDKEHSRCALIPGHNYKVWLAEEDVPGVRWIINAVHDITDGTRVWVKLNINKDGFIVQMQDPPNLILPNIKKGQLELF